MKFYTNQHKYYCGIDLHTKNMYVCILTQDGETVFHRNIKTQPDSFLRAIQPFREDIAVSVECMFTWYWLADLCEDEGIPFILGHALYMKAIHGGKSKNDKIDSNKIAALLRGAFSASALLTSISHDLKTPLAAILGAAGTMREFADKLDKDAELDLIGTIIDESERLSRFIVNLLDMTRIESGAMQPNYALHYVGDIVGTALSRAAKITGRHRTEMDIPSDLPMVRVDPVLFEQVLFNLIDNAAKYAPEDTTIRIAARRQDQSVQLEIMDEGPGIPPEDLERVFDSFYRVRKGDTVRAGTGLGLSISRGFIEAMGGTIVAGNRPGGRGAVFTITLLVPTGETILETSNDDDSSENTRR